MKFFIQLINYKIIKIFIKLIFKYKWILISSIIDDNHLATLKANVELFVSDIIAFSFKKSKESILLKH